jgi:hypothetical protein
VGSGVGSRPEGFDVTSQKQLKARIRTRMAATGERYAAARAQLVGTGGDHDDFRSVVDTGWTLRGGSDPDAAALANILANSRVVGPEGPLSEELIFLVAGGLGAGYILWEFKHDDSRVVTLGFTHLAQYLDRRLSAAISRLGVRAEWSRTSGAVGAAAELRRELAAGQPVVVWPDRYLIGYWQLPAFDGHGGHPVIAYAEGDGRIHLDDRTLATLTVVASPGDRFPPAAPSMSPLRRSRHRHVAAATHAESGAGRRAFRRRDPGTRRGATSHRRGREPLRGNPWPGKVGCGLAPCVMSLLGMSARPSLGCLGFQRPK